MISSPFLYALLQISLFLEVATVGFHLLLIYALFSRAGAAKYRYAQMSYTVQIHIYILPPKDYTFITSWIFWSFKKYIIFIVLKRKEKNIHVFNRFWSHYWFFFSEG